jgi:hypothetical protein
MIMAKKTFGAWLLEQAQAAPAEGAGLDDQLVYLAAATWQKIKGADKTRSTEGITKRFSELPDWEALRSALQAAVTRFSASAPIPPDAGNPPDAENTPAAGEPVPPPVHPYAGSYAPRQGAGQPGHCGMCAEQGHLIAHPGIECGRVGCTADHSADSGAGPQAEEELQAGPGTVGGPAEGQDEAQQERHRELAGPGRAPLVQADPDGHVIAGPKVAGQALEALEFVNRWRAFMAGPADDDVQDDLSRDAVTEAGRLLAIAGQALLDAAAALAGAAAGAPARTVTGDAGQYPGNGSGPENGAEGRATPNFAMEIAQKYGWAGPGFSGDGEG